MLSQRKHMNRYTDILSKYWGYPKFRDLQEDIIRSVAAGNDTLGLMPTGGGKSITYQVYSLSVEGICLVVTPLIALMKDQVENLTKRGIKAVAIYSGMTQEEINVALNNAAWGNYKFLYLSPERIATERFKDRLKQMNVNLIAVDEAHCISQWGYDFRPSYMRIAELRQLLPDVRVMALTATATPRVIDDIQAKLQFPKPCVLRKSFIRDNLAYKVRIEEDKLGYLTRTLQRATGCGVVYVRSRKKAREIAEMLVKAGVSANFYHAGLSAEARSKRQDEWLNNRTRVIVATNAFGMGIDKPDVRFVVHIDAPDSLEAYYQEAGRAGRDGKNAAAVLLFNKSDVIRLKKGVSEKFPPIEQIKSIYNALCNYLQIAVGYGKGMTYDFNLVEFATNYKFSILHTFNSLKILEREGYLELTDEVDKAGMVHFRVERDDLYRFQVANQAFDGFIKLLLRSYSGMFTEYRPISEELLAKRANISVDLVFKYLNHLDSAKIIHYVPRKKTPFIVLLVERVEAQRLRITEENYGERRRLYEQQINAVLHYGESTDVCRSRQLLAYFGETESKLCGRCDVCESMHELGISNIEFDRLQTIIRHELMKQPCERHELAFKIGEKEEQMLLMIRWLVDNEQIRIRVDDKLEWNSK